nr:unnamed protein product [Callosobruchus chinensis]
MQSREGQFDSEVTRP